jgi:hypothetical protein
MLGRRILIGCGGLLALSVVALLAVLVGSVIFGGGSSKTEPENVETAVEETAELRDRTLVVNEVERNYLPPNQFSRPEGVNEFIRVFIVLTNTSDEPLDYNPNNFKVQDSNGVQKTPQSIPELPYPVHHASLAPGGMIQGNMVFEIPQDDRGPRLLYEPFERNLGTVTVAL